MSEELKKLLERVEDASGPNTPLDHDILLAFGARYERDWDAEYYWPDGSRFYEHNITASIDAAVALVEKVLHGWASGHKLVTREDDCDAEIWGGPEISCGREAMFVAERNDRHAALALCAALLRAKLAEAEPK